MTQPSIHSHADCIFLSPFNNAWMDSMEERRQDMGRRIADLRVDQGLSQSQLATLAEIKQPSLSAIEAGETKEVTASTLIALCRALDTTWEYVWDGVGGDDEDAKQEAELLAIFRKLEQPGRDAVLQSARAVRAATLPHQDTAAVLKAARSVRKITSQSKAKRKA